MNKTSDYWREWFDQRARNTASDYVLNRGTTLKMDALENAAAKEFLRFVDPRTSDVVLDAGCGSGRNISLLSGRVGRVVGMDFSREMLARATSRVAQEGLTNVELQYGSVTQLPFADHTFDKVICTSVLQYLDQDDCQTAFHELLRVCRPGARVVLHLKNGTSLYAQLLRVMRFGARLIGRSVKPEHYRSRRWHFDALARVGATVVEYDSFGIFTFPLLPQPVVARVLRMELHCARGSWLKRYGVNFQLVCVAGKP